MARDYENVTDIESMDDDEVADLIRQEIAETPNLDGGEIEINVTSGRVVLEGRVGSEQEYQRIERVVTDLLGIKDVSNNLIVDEFYRAQQADAADVATGDRAANSNGSSVPGDRTSDTAEHLLTDTAGDQFGTSDMSEAISEGLSYNPPDNPV
jgi:hypothetical protein